MDKHIFAEEFEYFSLSWTSVLRRRSVELVSQCVVLKLEDLYCGEEDHRRRTRKGLLTRWQRSTVGEV